MSYLSSNLGPSPFLNSLNHNYPDKKYSSTLPHYSTNPYTSVPTYLAAYATPSQVYQEKYFPKDIINVLPGVTNLASEDEKLIHPLNTDSGNVFSTHCIRSPFNRGKIHIGNNYPTNTISPSFTTSSLLDHRVNESYLIKKDNPFNKKYLLNEKNMELQNYAQYSSVQRFQLSQLNKNRKKSTNRNVQKFPSKRYPTFDKEQLTDEVLEFRTKKNINVQQRQHNTNQIFKKKQLRSDNKTFNLNPFENHVLDQNYHQQHLVESQVDQNQFGSFGQGKQKDNQINQYRSHENSNQYLKINKDQAESIIVGLTNMVSKQNHNFNDQKQKQQKSKRQLLFLDSEDDDRNSGTFMVPNAIIEQINNPRISTNLANKKHFPSNFSHQKDQEKQHLRYKKQEAIQVGKNSPNKITMRGKTFQKISI